MAAETFDGRAANPAKTQNADMSTHFHSDSVAEGVDSIEKRDYILLARLGKRPVLKREYGLLSAMGFSCISLCTWEAVSSTLSIGLENGGPAGSLYMYLFAWVGATATYASLCELASMAPISSGQYFWVAMLAPRAQQKFLSYITGWMTVIGWQSATASAAYISGTLIQGIATTQYAGYVAQPWHAVLIIWGFLLFGLAINTVARKLLPWMEGHLLVLHILAFFGVLIPVAVLGNHRSADEVWRSFNNGGAWPTQGLSTMIGLLMSLFLFTGVDGVVHMSEEIKNAAVNIPRAIMFSMALNGSLGFAICIVFLYALGNLDDALESAAGYPVFPILTDAFDSAGGASAVIAILAFMQVFAATSTMAAASRQLWSFSRDRAVPAWAFFVHVDTNKTLPIRSVVMSAIIPALLMLIVLGSSVAFNDILGLVTSGFYSSYYVALLLLLYRRLTGAIQEPAKSDDRDVNNVGRRLVWGPWRIRGAWGVAVNVVALAFLTIAIFFCFWPPDSKVTAKNMNYNVLVFGGVLVLATAYYWLFARREYTGPVVEVERVD